MTFRRGGRSFLFQQATSAPAEASFYLGRSFPRQRKVIFKSASHFRCGGRSFLFAQVASALAEGRFYFSKSSPPGRTEQIFSKTFTFFERISTLLRIDSRGRLCDARN
jgi:hypothetical protein